MKSYCMKCQSRCANCHRDLKYGPDFFGVLWVVIVLALGVGLPVATLAAHTSARITALEEGTPPQSLWESHCSSRSAWWLNLACWWTSDVMDKP